MTLSKRTQYGLRALICLADAYEHGYLQTRELAEREHLPAKFLESILSALTRGKFLNSRIGASGGYRLARSPRDIHLADVVARLEGTIIGDEPGATALPAAGERPGEVAVRLIETQITSAVRNVFHNFTLAALADKVSAHSGGQMYYI